MKKIRVLFVCIHNSARSQMAEAILQNLAGDRFEAESAGLTPGALLPLAVDVMKEWNIDISRCTTKSVFQFFKDGKSFDYVITVCDETSGEQCPIFSGTTTTKRIHWTFEAPSGFTGTYEEKLARTRAIRNAIRSKIEEWIAYSDESGHRFQRKAAIVSN